MSKKPDWAALNGETRNPLDLTPSPYNPRKHAKEQLETLARLYDEFGWTTRVLVDENNVIIAGHGRVQAAILRDLKEIPVFVARGWSEDKKKAYVVADNQVGLMSSWDDGLLDKVLSELDEAGMDLTLLGFPALAEEDALSIEEVPVFETEGRFWVSVKGPFQMQADALQRPQEAMKDLPGVEVEMGSIFNG